MGDRPAFNSREGAGPVAAAGFYPRWGKRAFDLIASGVSLILLSPLLAVCALMVRLTSPGPVFFRQTRIGLDARPFKIFKFRTMHLGSDRGAASVVVSRDPRVTLVGWILRKTKLDEVPQLINVFRGEMSFVGPRPRVPDLVDLENPEERALLSLRPGLTSYASVFHRMEELYCRSKEDPQKTYQELQTQKGYLDGDYHRTLSLLLDLKLMFLTALLVFLPGKGEARALRFGTLEFRPYGRTAQMLIEAVVFAAAIWLAYWLRFEEEISEFHRLQRAAFIVLLPAARVAANHFFGIYNLMWRYLNLVDATIVVTSLTAVSGVVLFLRLVLPSRISAVHVFQLPLGVIAIECLLVVSASLGLRALRKLLYEMNHHYQPFPAEDRRRRVLILGAGLTGLGIASEMARHSHLHLVGFLDDDPAKDNRRISGHRVLGSSSSLPNVVRQHQVTDLIVCARSLPAGQLDRIQEWCADSRVRIHVIPSVDQILMHESAITNQNAVSS